MFLNALCFWAFPTTKSWSLFDEFEHRATVIRSSFNLNPGAELEVPTDNVFCGNRLKFSPVLSTFYIWSGTRVSSRTIFSSLEFGHKFIWCKSISWYFFTTKFTKVIMSFFNLWSHCRLQTLHTKFNLEFISQAFYFEIGPLHLSWRNQSYNESSAISFAVFRKVLHLVKTFSLSIWIKNSSNDFRFRPHTLTVLFNQFIAYFADRLTFVNSLDRNHNMFSLYSAYFCTLTQCNNLV